MSVASLILVWATQHFRAQGVEIQSLYYFLVAQVLDHAIENGGACALVLWVFFRMKGLCGCKCSLHRAMCAGVLCLMHGPPFTGGDCHIHLFLLTAHCLLPRSLKAGNAKNGPDLSSCHSSPKSSLRFWSHWFTALFLCEFLCTIAQPPGYIIVSWEGTRCCLCCLFDPFRSSETRTWTQLRGRCVAAYF